MIRALTIVGALAAGMLLGGWTWPGDRQGAYCHYTRDFTNCGYPSLDACLATRSGVGGNCGPNPKYIGPPPERRQRYR